MGKGLSRRRREQNFLKAHGTQNALPPPPSASGKSDSDYQPKSLQRLLQVKALAEGRGKSPNHRLAPPKAEDRRHNPQQSASAALAPSSRSSRAEGTSRPEPAEVPQSRSQRPVRAKRKEFLKARKQRLKVSKAQADTPELAADQPAFGEQVLAPPQIKFKRKSKK